MTECICANCYVVSVGAAHPEKLIRCHITRNVVHPAMTLEAKLKHIYSLELNAQISWFWDGGFDAKLGDDRGNGWIDDGNFETLEEAGDWLLARALQFMDDFKKRKRLNDRQSRSGD